MRPARGGDLPKLLHATALAACMVALVPSAAGLNNGLALRPPMGWNTWNAYHLDISEEKARRNADLMQELGLVEAGYTYFIIDDGWSELLRSDAGELVAHKKRFPSGMKTLSDHLHSKGLKLGIYSDSGEFTCQGFPGSRGHEVQDAQTWASWGVDYLKYDNCWAPASDWVIDRYAVMRDALNRTGRGIVFSLCEWGVMDPWLWADKVGHSWRTTNDISPTIDSILRKLDDSMGLARFAGPGGWNDLDMLEVGNGGPDGFLSLAEQRAHFALWCLYKSPLLIGTDLHQLSGESLAVLKAREVIAIHQDELGVAGDLVWKQGPEEIHAGPLADAGRAVILFNRHTRLSQVPTANITVWWEQVGLPKGSRARVRDLFAEQDLGEFEGSFTAAVGIHDVMVLKVMPDDDARDTSWRPWQHQPMFRASGPAKGPHQAGLAADNAGGQLGDSGRQIRQLGGIGVAATS